MYCRYSNLTDMYTVQIIERMFQVYSIPTFNPSSTRKRRYKSFIARVKFNNSIKKTTHSKAANTKQSHVNYAL